MKTVKIIAALVLITLAVIYREAIVGYLEIITDQELVSNYLKSFGAFGPACWSSSSAPSSEARSLSALPAATGGA